MKLKRYYFWIIIISCILSCKQEKEVKRSWVKEYLLPAPHIRSYAVDIDGDKKQDTVEIDVYYTIRFSKLDTTIIFPFPVEFIKPYPPGYDFISIEDRIDTNAVKLHDFDNDGRFELFGRVFTDRHNIYKPDSGSGLTTNYMIIEYENDKVNVYSIPWSISVNQYYNSKKFDDLQKLTVKQKGRRFGYINRKGRWAILPELDDAYDFNCGRAIVKKNGVRYIINKKGEILSELKSYHYTEADTFSNSCYVTIMGCLTECSDMCLIDTNGHFIEFREENCLSDIRQFNEGVASAAIESNDKWGYVNEKLEWVIQPKYDATYTFHKGLGVVKNEDVYKHVNIKGEIIPIKYKNGRAKIIILGQETYIYENGKTEKMD